MVVGRILLVILISFKSRACKSPKKICTIIIIMIILIIFMLFWRANNAHKVPFSSRRYLWKMKTIAYLLRAITTQANVSRDSREMATCYRTVKFGSQETGLQSISRFFFVHERISMVLSNVASVTSKFKPLFAVQNWRHETQVHAVARCVQETLYSNIISADVTPVNNMRAGRRCEATRWDGPECCAARVSSCK